MTSKELTKEYLEKFLFADFEKGETYWKEGALPKKNVGKRAGYVAKPGNRNITIKGRVYQEHTILWTMYYGSPPENNLKHINGNPSDNRIENLKNYSWYKSEKGSGEVLKNVKHFFEYDSVLGILSRKEEVFEQIPKKMWEGTRDHNGYTSFVLHGKTYKAHRIIWTLVHGYWPENIDHINGDRSDNRISNLREVSMRGNSNNLLRHREGLLVGAHYHLKIRRWVSAIKINKKKVHLGCSSTMEGANSLYTFAMANLDKYTGNAKEFREYVKSHALVQK